MSKPLTESYSIDLSEQDFVHLHHEQNHSYFGASSDDLWFERQNLSWVIPTLRTKLATVPSPAESPHPRRIWRHEFATHESHVIDESDPDFIHIRYVQIAADGTDMGGSMWFERSSLHHVVDALRTCLSIVPPVPKADIGQDHFVLYRDHHGSPTLYGLENHRLLATPHGGNHTLLMGRGLTRRVVRDLAAVARESGPEAGTRRFWDEEPPEVESYSIKASQTDFVRIRLKQVAGTSGVERIQNLWLERANLPWLADALRACLSRSDFADARLEEGQDRLEVYRTHVEPVFINLFNDRPVRAPHGHMYFLSMTRPTARKLLRRLAWLSRYGRLKKLVGWPVHSSRGRPRS